jgi:hypothetical protein
VTLFGVDIGYLDLALSAINTLVVVLGVGFAIHTLRQSMSQRLNESLEKLLEEYRSADFSKSVRHVMAKFPIFEGELDERISSFIDYGHRHLDDTDIIQARAVVHKLNDLGMLVERGTVREVDFFGHTHPRIIEIGTRLDPMILAVSAHLGWRWGMRLRRLRLGAITYFRFSRFYGQNDFTVDGKVLVPADPPSWYERLWGRIRPVRRNLRILPMASSTRKSDDRELATAARVLGQFPRKKLAFLDHLA